MVLTCESLFYSYSYINPGASERVSYCITETVCVHSILYIVTYICINIKAYTSTHMIHHIQTHRQQIDSTNRAPCGTSTQTIHGDYDHGKHGRPHTPSRSRFEITPTCVSHTSSWSKLTHVAAPQPDGILSTPARQQRVGYSL